MTTMMMMIIYMIIYILYLLLILAIDPRTAISLKHRARHGWKRNGINGITNKHKAHSMTQAEQFADKAEVLLA